LGFFFKKEDWSEKFFLSAGEEPTTWRRKDEKTRPPGIRMRGCVFLFRWRGVAGGSVVVIAALSLCLSDVPSKMTR
jgi:hypothetical protein